MTLTWKYFLSKRRMTPSSFVEARKLTSYESLVSHLASLHIEPPAFDEVAHLFRKNLATAPSAPLDAAKEDLADLIDHPVSTDPVSAVPDETDLLIADTNDFVETQSAQDEFHKESYTHKKTKKPKTSQNRRYIVSSSFSVSTDEKSDND